MFYRFEHTIALPVPTYERAVRKYAGAGPEAEPIGTHPSFIERGPRGGEKLRRAGYLYLVSATEEDFAGLWWLNDDPNVSATRGYEDMLEQEGIPRTVDYPSYGLGHVVGGKKVEEGIFAATSIFSTSERLPGSRKPTAAGERRQAAANAIRWSWGNPYYFPEVNSFTYGDIRDLARAVGPKLKPSR